MSLTNELYRETILDHYHHPRNRGLLKEPTIRIEGNNPLCGDELTLCVNIRNGKIEDIMMESKGCSINTASGSMMSEVVKGKPLDEAQKIAGIFKNMMLNKEDVALAEDLQELEALEGVKKYPVRIKCALLPWNALLEGLESLEPADTVNPHRKIHKKHEELLPPESTGVPSP